MSLMPQNWIPSGKGKRLIVLHAGTRSEGLIDGYELVFMAKSKEMNSFVFLEWLKINWCLLWKILAWLC